jgi:outer membrane protein assembly factor BamB
MRAHPIVLSVALLTLCGCAAHFASRKLGVARAPDPRVAVFRSDRAASWRQFRLGDGLNVVVVNPKLPSEFAWRIPTGGVSSSPTVMGSTVFVSCNDDHVYAIDAATGAVRWRYHAENEVMSQPAYANGLVYVGIGNSENTVFDPPHLSVIGSGMNKIEAIDAKTGIEQWWSGLIATGMPSQAIVGNTLIAVDGAGSVFAIDARTGAFRWYRDLLSDFAMSSVVDGGNGRIYLSGRFPSVVYALRSSDGAVIWEHGFSNLYGAIGDDPLASADGMLVGVFLEPLGRGKFGSFTFWGSKAREHVYALDERNGNLLWDTTLPTVVGTVPKYNEAAIALIYGGRIYVGSAVAPIVTALDMRGHVLWQVHVRGAVKGGIAAVDGVVYLGDLGGYLWAIDAKSGHVVGSVSTDMRFNVGSPIIVNDSLIQGGLQDVIAVPLADIRESHQVPGVTRLTMWERAGRFFSGLIPRSDPHLEQSYFHR